MFNTQHMGQRVSTYLEIECPPEIRICHSGRCWDRARHTSRVASLTAAVIRLGIPATDCSTEAALMTQALG
jgi:hypothetical protein